MACGSDDTRIARKAILRTERTIRGTGSSFRCDMLYIRAANDPSKRSFVLYFCWMKPGLTQSNDPQVSELVVAQECEVPPGGRHHKYDEDSAILKRRSSAIKNIRYSILAKDLSIDH